MHSTFIHTNIAKLLCLAAVDVVETCCKESFVLQMWNATISLIKHTCDRISKNYYTLCKYFSIYKNEFNKNLLEKERLNNCLF